MTDPTLTRLEQRATGPGGAPEWWAVFGGGGPVQLGPRLQVHSGQEWRGRAGWYVVFAGGPFRRARYLWEGQPRQDVVEWLAETRGYAEAVGQLRGLLGTDLVGDGAGRAYRHELPAGYRGVVRLGADGVVRPWEG